MIGLLLTLYSLPVCACSNLEQVLPCDIFTVLPLKHNASRPSVSDFVWTGESNAAEFRVACIPGTAPGRFGCEAEVIEGSRVKRLSFGIEVVGPGFLPRAIISGNNGEVELDTFMEEEAGNVAEVPWEELVFVGELGKGVQAREPTESRRVASLRQTYHDSDAQQARGR